MRAAVFAGGGALGALEVGAFNRMVEVDHRPIGIYTGTSVGALNAAYLAMEENERTAAAGLETLWRSIETADVHKRIWPLGMLTGLWRPHLRNARPLHDLVRLRLNQPAIRRSGKMLRVTAVNLNTGALRVFGETSLNLMSGILASSAFPLVFQPVVIDGVPYTDGGVRELAPLKSAITAGATEIDVFLSGARSAPVAAAPGNVIDMAKTMLPIMLDEMLNNDLRVCEHVNETIAMGIETSKRPINIRVFEPRLDEPFDPLDFSPHRIATMLEIGARTADKVLGS